MLNRPFCDRFGMVFADCLHNSILQIGGDICTVLGASGIATIKGVIAAAAIIFILYKYVFNTSDCDGEVDVCGVCNGMGLSCCYNEKCPKNQECNPSTGSCECKSGHFDCSGVCDGTNIDCCLEDCSGNAPDCDIKTRKCFCKAMDM